MTVSHLCDASLSPTEIAQVMTTTTDMKCKRGLPIRTNWPRTKSAHLAFHIVATSELPEHHLQPCYDSIEG
jgi:hypothetical protein